MPEFSPTTDVGELVDTLLEFDTRWMERARNGMTRDMFLRASILNEFLNQNFAYDDIDKMENGSPDPEFLRRAAETCSAYYLIEPTLLVEDFTRCMGTEFMDPENRDRIEKEMAEYILESKISRRSKHHSD
jgi:hypothetical protein